MTISPRFIFVLVSMAFIMTFSVNLFAAELSTDKTYTNPILDNSKKAGADPAIIFHEGKYYFYATNGGPHVFISKDMVNWKKGPRVLPEKFRGIWAPEVYYHEEDGKFYMYYTKRYKIGVAVADRPDAMFKDLGYIVLSAIDAHMFRDDDGRLYLYFTKTAEFDMYCVPMKSPTEIGSPITKCFEISQDWERHHFPINEGPWIVKQNGTYYMLYCGSDGQSIYYAIGCATAPTPIGPFTKYEDNPVFQDLEKIKGPGHGSIIKDRAGQMWHLYHQKTGEEIGWRRDICLDRMYFDENGKIGGTPTRGVKMPAPICDKNLVWQPEISPRGAFFNDSETFTITCKTEGAEIRYTTSGTEPDENSALYTGPIEISSSVTVKARAFKKGMKTSTAVHQKFTKTDTLLPANPSPNGPQIETPPFTFFKTPNPDWVKK